MGGAGQPRDYRRWAGNAKLPAGNSTSRDSYPSAGPTNSEALRRLGVQTVVALDPELLPTRLGLTRWTEALAALTAAAPAVVRRLGGDERDLWPVIAFTTGGRLLAPTLST